MIQVVTKSAGSIFYRKGGPAVERLEFSVANGLTLTTTDGAFGIGSPDGLRRVTHEIPFIQIRELHFIAEEK